MNILYCKNLWWPFGSHLMHTMHRKCYADMNGYKLLYTIQEHPAYSLYGGKLSELFASISDIDDLDIIEFASKNYPNANHNNHFLLKFTDKKEFIESTPIDYNGDIGTAKWHEFKPEFFDTVKQYQASIMKKIAEPSNNVKGYLQTLPFIQEVSKLNGDYIAVHIRWTDKVEGWCTEADFYDVDVYFKYAIELREKYGTNNIVLNCDNIDALNKFLDYNKTNNLSFNILYDKEEKLPVNDWKASVFQRHCLRLGVETKEFINDLLNGFKIFKTIYEASSVICNYYSNMALAPCVARNSSKDINISKKNPYAIFPGKYWPRDMFSQNVKEKRLEGNKLKEAIK
jgi:hypothetical protein